jgi:hypothetical protein
MKVLQLFSLALSLLVTGCIGGVTVEKKDSIDSSTEYERVVQVDYGTQSELEFDDNVENPVEDEAPQADENESSSYIEEDNSIPEETSNQNEYCGVIYKSKNSNLYYLKSSGKTYELALTSNLEYGLDTNLNFPLDSADICLLGLLNSKLGKFNLWGYSGTNGTIDVSSLSSSLIVSTEHPDRSNHRASFTNEYCGTITLEANPHNSLNIFKINTHEGQNFDLKFSTSLGDSNDEQVSYVYNYQDIIDHNINITNGNYCLYGNALPENEEIWTYRKFFRVQTISGPWN